MLRPYVGTHFRRNSPPSATPVVAQNRNIHLSSSLFNSASLASSWCQRASHLASDCARRCSSLASNRDRKHTSELQSQSNLVCRLLLEKKKITNRVHAL